MRVARYGISDDAENRSVLGRIRERRPASTVHPRTRDRLDATGLATLTRLPGLQATPPLGYLDMLALLDRAELRAGCNRLVDERRKARGKTLTNVYRRPVDVPLSVKE
jgi:hypothetical protein